MGGVPPTLAVGDPVSGNSTAVKAALPLFNLRECLGGNVAVNTQIEFYLSKWAKYFNVTTTDS